MRRGVQNVAYGNPIYQKILASGEAPERLHFTLPDPWPGDAQAGLVLMAGQRSMFEKAPSAPVRHAGTHLRNLRAVGTDAARQMALRLIYNWLEHHDGWHEDEWAPATLGERIASWISFYEFYAPVASPDLIARLTTSLHRQWKHLARTLSPNLTGIEGLQAVRGLVYGALNFEEGERALGLAADLLQRQITLEILADGGHISRNPSVHLHMVRHLADLRAIFKAAELELPEAARIALSTMPPVLKFFRQGDGGLALFNGGSEETPLLIEAVITQAESRGRSLRRLPQMGYERVNAGRSLLIVDTGKPAPRGYDAAAHAGLLGFEFGQGRERLIVNCGAAPAGGIEWRMACASTAAHSTLTLEDTNACEILAGGVTSSSIYVTSQRYEQNGSQCLELTHDGYRNRFGILHQRFLALSPDGVALHGRDILAGTSEKNFVFRWHLHPLVQASLAQNGQTAILRLPSGGGWRFRIERGELGLEPSIYCGNGAPRRSLQLKVSGQTDEAQTAVNWSLVREKKI
jgi:uncharacterized heparinase superfamily protein